MSKYGTRQGVIYCAIAVLAGALAACGGSGDATVPPVPSEPSPPPKIPETYGQCLEQLASLPAGVASAPVSVTASEPIAVADVHVNEWTGFEPSSGNWNGARYLNSREYEFPPRTTSWVNESGETTVAQQVMAETRHTGLVFYENAQSRETVFASQPGYPYNAPPLLKTTFYGADGRYLGRNGTFNGIESRELSTAEKALLAKGETMALPSYGVWEIVSGGAPTRFGMYEISYRYDGLEAVQTGLMGEVHACKLVNERRFHAVLPDGYVIKDFTRELITTWSVPRVGVIYREEGEWGSNDFDRHTVVKVDLAWRVVNGVKYTMPRTNPD
ncbi:hypothetical protein GCM10007860_26960 [Chitiniphilus shinanonensis]|uniref:Lipoprotein n=2 Tax=Chitiniphilus shinanonensis TaxID=553088 RepID=A0ABQ6BZ84_9NEIS|nr:hypothetical protein GCM10007860_26960 [Chitiniphilus shinanonensis]